MTAHTCKACGRSYRHASSLSRHNATDHAETYVDETFYGTSRLSYYKGKEITHEEPSDNYTTEGDDKAQDKDSDSSSVDEEEDDEEWHWHLASMAFERSLICYNTKFRSRVEELVRDGANLDDSIDQCSVQMSTKISHDRRNFMAFFLCAIDNCTSDDRFIDVMTEKDKRGRKNDDLDDFDIYRKLVDEYNLADWLLRRPNYG